jgi:molybdenum cofactor guanylyltransferase
MMQGLATARGEVCLVVAGDMPFVSRAAFEHLLAVQRRVGADVVVPRIGGVLQPMRAVVRRAPALQTVRTALASGEWRLFGALLALDPHEVQAGALRVMDPQLRTFFNVNTPQDLVEARRIARGQPAQTSDPS